MRKIMVWCLGVLGLMIIELYAGILFPVPSWQNTCLQGNNQVFLFAHRGMDRYFPENSLEGYRAALEKGLDALELDIRMSSDRQILIFHDANGKRLIGKDLDISSVSAREILSSPLLFKDSLSGSFPIHLDRFFAEIPGLFPVYIDIKNIKDFPPREEINQLLEVIQSCRAENRVLLASSDFLLLRKIKKRLPEVNVVLEGFNAGKEWVFFLIPPRWRPDYFSGVASKITKKHMNWLEKKKLINRRIVYGVNENNFDSLRNMGIRCMIIDYDHYLDPYLNPDHSEKSDKKTEDLPL